MAWAVAGCTCEHNDRPQTERLAAEAASTERPTRPVRRLEREDPEVIANLPVEEDFREQASREINEDNLEAELDKIERELSAER